MGETCITYESVDAAFLAAAREMKLPTTRSKTLSESEVDHLAKVIVETTRILAHQ